MKQKRPASGKSARAASKSRRLTVVAENDTAMLEALDMPQPQAVSDARADEIISAPAAVMPASVGPVAAGSALTLAENCILRDAAALKDELLKLREVSEPVTIDITAVQRIETANLQVLGAFVRDRRNAGLAVHWSGQSQAMTQAVKLLGMGEWLQLGSAA